ncbi:hypothetical protein [Paenibacillus sp. 1P07SE]|uniref:hypothetical protein n=1 Tax=Paenibacillus sp. 1P07SE TaxID=3132209 RepID=UPI0039A4C087
MRLRLFPLALTAILAAALLLGGWSLYNSMALQKPLTGVVEEVPGVRSAEPVIDRTRVQLRLELERGAGLREIYQAIRSNGADYIGSRQLQLEVVQTPDEQLDDLWSMLLFDIAQAMETRHYADIPAALDRLAGQTEGLTATTEMDADNVYITLENDKAAKYVILPRVPSEMGVWSHA